MKRRSITIVYESSLTDEGWKQLVDEITESVEQAACDYAASCEVDDYRVDVFVGELHDDLEVMMIKTWRHDESRDGAGCSWCGRWAKVNEEGLCRDCFMEG